jgi:hypothetical protein
MNEYDDERQRQPANDAAGKEDHGSSDRVQSHGIGRQAPKSWPKGCV